MLDLAKMNLTMKPKRKYFQALKGAWKYVFPFLPVFVLASIMLWTNQNDIIRAYRAELISLINSKTILFTCPAKNSKGSGFFIDEEYYFTAYHVIEGCPVSDMLIAQSLSVVSIEYQDPTKDAAILKVAVDNYKAPIVNLSCDLPYLNEKVVMAGFPLTITDKVKQITGDIVMPYWFGVFDSKSMMVKPNFTAIVGSEVFQGMSGGPVFDESSAQVIGWNVYVANPHPDLTKYAGIGLMYDVCQYVKGKNVRALDRLAENTNGQVHN